MDELALIQQEISVRGDKYGFYKDSKAPINYSYDSLCQSRIKHYYFAKKDKYWGLVTNKDSAVLPFEHDWITENSHLANSFIAQKNGYLGVVDAHNNVILEFQYDAISGWCEYGPPGYYVQRAGKIGLLKPNGEVLIPAIYDALYYYNSNLVLVVKGGLFGVLKLDNSVVLPLIYSLVRIRYNMFDKLFEDSEEQSTRLYAFDGAKWISYSKFGDVVVDELSENQVEILLNTDTIRRYDDTYINHCLIYKYDMDSK